MKKHVLSLSAFLLAGALGVFGATSATAVTTEITNIATDGSYNLVSVSNDGSLVAAAAEYNEIVIYTVDTQESRIVSTPGTDIGAVVFSPDNQWLYVAGYDETAIYVIDLSDDSLDRTISMPEDIWNLLTISPDGNTLYAGAYSSDNLYSVALDNNDTVSAALAAGDPSAWQLCISSDGSTVYFPDYSNGELDVIDTATWEVADSWTTGSDPFTCTMDNDDNVYVVNSGEKTVTKFTPAGVATQGAQNSVDSIYGITTSCNTLYLGDYNSNEIVTADLTTLDETGDLIQVTSNDSGFYTYSAARSLDGSVVAFGGYYGSDGLAVITTPECATADDSALPQTGASVEGNILGGTVLAMVGAVAVFIARRRTAVRN
ncbi:MAG: YncE family protein [Microbacteriaceae bacterium]